MADVPDRRYGPQNDLGDAPDGCGRGSTASEASSPALDFSFITHLLSTFTIALASALCPCVICLYVPYFVVRVVLLL